MRRLRNFQARFWGSLATLLALGGLLAASAAADTAPAGTANLVPNTASAPSHFKLDARGQPAGLRPNQIPHSLLIAFQSGFGFDFRAAGRTCSAQQAGDDKCPSESKIGSGQVDVLVSGLGFPAAGQEFTAELTFYAAPPPRPGDLGGVVFRFEEKDSGFKGESTGRLVPVTDPVYGAQLRFDRLPIPTLPPGLDVTLKRLTMDLGAHRTVGATPPRRRTTRRHRRHRRHRRRHHRHRRHHRRAHSSAGPTYDLIKNPALCVGSWSIQVQITYEDGRETRDAPAACTAL